MLRFGHILMLLMFLFSCSENENTLLTDKNQKEEILENSSVSARKNIEQCNTIIESPTFDLKSLFGNWETPELKRMSKLILDSNYISLEQELIIKECYILKKDKLHLITKDYNLTGWIKKADSNILEIYWSSGDYGVYKRKG